MDRRIGGGMRSWLGVYVVKIWLEKLGDRVK